MKIVKIPKADLDLFAAILPRWGELWAPVKRGKSWVFDRPSLWSDVQLSYPRTILSPKQFVLPPSEALCEFDPAGGFRDLVAQAARPVVLFGVHAYDIWGLNILDRVFGQGRFLDPYYLARRRNLVVIGVDFEPDDKNFASSMHADFVDDGFDLYLSDLGTELLVLVGTSRGEDIVAASGALVQEPGPADFAEYKRRSALRRAAGHHRVTLEDLPEILEMEYGSAIWDELGQRCLSCGSCTAVCPTCYCFDVADRVELGSRRGQRLRSWDSCLLRSHALVAGGENFRKGRGSRVKFRFYHKQRGFVAEYGRPSCVGCGRCTVACPAGIDIVTVIKRIRGEEDEHPDHPSRRPDARGQSV